jgi:hypothetical protein
MATVCFYSPPHQKQPATGQAKPGTPALTQFQKPPTVPKWRKTALLGLKTDFLVGLAWIGLDQI